MSACEWTETYSPAAIDMAPSYQSGNSCNQYVAVSCMRGCDTQHQTRCGQYAVVCTQDRSAQPADAPCAVALLITSPWAFTSLLDLAGIVRKMNLDPLLSQQPHFDDLRKAHVAEQREQQNWPVQSRQVRETQRRGQGGIRQPHAKCHDGIVS